jgi:glycosyltransferase involved in cell wall biosynthesis
MKSVDIVTSAFNEEECLPELFRRIDEVFKLETNYVYRIIVADNSSSDNTWEIITEAAKGNSKISANRMSRTFSFDAALRSGIDHSTSDVVVIMTSDLQDPPEVIPQLLRKYEEGFEQVLVKITSRETVPFFRRILSAVFYRLAHRMTAGLLPESVSDFRLLSRNAYRSISSMRESHSFVRGLGAWVGFKTTTIEIQRPPRFAGESKFLKFSLIAAITMSFRSLLAYSAAPLLWISFLGLFLSAFFFLAVIVLSIIWLTAGVPFAGFGSLVGLIGLGFSLIMLTLGIIAQYIGLIYEEVKRRPIYVIAESINPLV